MASKFDVAHNLLLQTMNFGLESIALIIKLKTPTPCV